MIRMYLLTALLLTTMPTFAKRVVVNGGQVMMRGELVDSACSVTPESQELKVDMGQYRTNSFYDIGSFASVTVPFTLKLAECRTDMASLVGIAFQGVSPAEDPQVFMASPEDNSMTGESGLGLALFDAEQQQIIPNASPAHYFQIMSGEMALHFSARYRVISLPLTPGNLKSNLLFTLVYP